MRKKLILSFNELFYFDQEGEKLKKAHVQLWVADVPKNWHYHREGPPMIHCVFTI